MITLEIVLAALALPPDCRIGLRVAKKLLMEQGLPTPADKKRVQEGVEDVLWVAALKPNRIGVPPCVDAVRAYREIVVLTATLRPKAKPQRLIEVLHRAVPHPVLLLVEQEGAITVSTAHKRHSQAEKDATVLDAPPVTVALSPGDAETDRQFLDTLAVSSLPSASLHAMIQGWVDRIEALRAARITGRFRVPGEETRSGTRGERLAQWEALRTELASLRQKARTETQMNRRVELNREIKNLEARQNELRDEL